METEPVIQAQRSAEETDPTIQSHASEAPEATQDKDELTKSSLSKENIPADTTDSAKPESSSRPLPSTPLRPTENAQQTATITTRRPSDDAQALLISPPLSPPDLTPDRPDIPAPSSMPLPSTRHPHTIISSPPLPPQSSTTTPLPLLPDHSSPPSIPALNLEHPPGYIQNTAAISADHHHHHHDHGHDHGHWRWSDAPNLAGGRYVYSSSSSSSVSMLAAARDAQRCDIAENDQFGISGPDDGGVGDDGWGWVVGAGWVWEGAKSWGRSVGSRLAEAEEGVWRWVNRKT
ncbi:hypothetical protein PRK78_000764 [Emydomyces testavorans]|uniref:Uncharacterized protein n=1 Tax=Emydomyces testavorans TaxID=2070801 RepID=A0AAF0DBR7_9EURO|nr:hypothetical protein PRK78_000764 [Emydomyces testavorans]